MTLNKDKHFVFETPDLECPEEVPKTGKRLNWEADEEREQNPQDKESKVLKRKCISAFSLWSINQTLVLLFLIKSYLTIH